MTMTNEAEPTTTDDDEDDALQQALLDIIEAEPSLLVPLSRATVGCVSLVETLLLCREHVKNPIVDELIKVAVAAGLIDMREAADGEVGDADGMVPDVAEDIAETAALLVHELGLEDTDDAPLVEIDLTKVPA